MNKKKLNIFFYCLMVLFSCTIYSCGDDSAEIDVAARQLMEQNMEELRITADENCLEKRATYIKMYKDSLANLKGKKATQGYE